MADFSPSKKTISDFNNGQKYRNGVDTPNADDFNGVIESQLWTQSLATNQPNIENVSGSGNPSVSIEETPNGTPRFKFENLGGGAINQNGDLSIIATFNITEVNTTIILADLIGMTSIDWGDGTVNKSLTHTYTAIGEYTCKIYGVTSIGSDTVGDDGRNGFLNCKPLTKLIIGNSVTKIGIWGVGRCDNLKSVVIPDSVTEIGSLAFGHCFNLTSVNIPYGITKIDSQCFYECTSLTSIEIPETVTEIGRAAFGACSSLKTIEVNAKTPPTLGENVFGYGTSPTRMISPIESLETYKTAGGWSDYATLICSYVTSKDFANYNKAGLIKTSNTRGLSTSQVDGTTSIEKASNNEINAKASIYKPIVPASQDYAWKMSAIDNKEEWTDEDKTKACETIGAVGKKEIGDIESALTAILGV